jgi:hypothetical protein
VALKGSHPHIRRTPELGFRVLLASDFEAREGEYITGGLYTRP